MSRSEVMAACVNSSLGLWDLARLERVRTYTGHANVRNFVGMDVNGDHVVCGSETSQVRGRRAAVSASSAQPVARGEARG